MRVRHEPAGWSCPFCNLLAGITNADSAADDIVASEGLVFARIGPKWWPANPGAVLVVPTAHHENLYGLPSEVRVTQQRRTAAADELLERCLHGLPLAGGAGPCTGTSTPRRIDTPDVLHRRPTDSGGRPGRFARMGWLSRTFGSGDDTPASAPGNPPANPDASAPQSGPPVPVAPQLVAPLPVADAPSGTPTPTPSGRYGPLVSVTHFDTAPPELEWQLPLNGELYRLMPGSDRPDYSLFVLERPVHFYPADGFDLGRVEAEQRVEDRKGRPMVRVHALLLCARFVGQQLHPGMKDLAVNLAYVIDNSLARDAEVDFGKIEFAAIGFLSEGHTPRPGADNPADTPADTAAEGPADATPGTTAAYAADPAQPHTAADATGGEEGSPANGGGVDAGAVAGVLDEVAAVLRQGIEAQRGVPVQRMTAALTVDAAHRLTGLSGNADGQAPVPTPETFARLADVLARLGAAGGQGDAGVASFTVRVDGDSVSHEVTATH